MKFKFAKWGVVAAFFLGFYGLAETRGWAMGGTKVKDPITQQDLRSGTPGSPCFPPTSTRLVFFAETLSSS